MERLGRMGKGAEQLRPPIARKRPCWQPVLQQCPRQPQTAAWFRGSNDWSKYDRYFDLIYTINSCDRYRRFRCEHVPGPYLHYQAILRLRPQQHLRNVIVAATRNLYYVELGSRALLLATACLTVLECFGQAPLPFACDNQNDGVR